MTSCLLTMYMIAWLITFLVTSASWNDKKSGLANPLLCSLLASICWPIFLPLTFYAGIRIEMNSDTEISTRDYVVAGSAIAFAESVIFLLLWS